MKELSLVTSDSSSVHDEESIVAELDKRVKNAEPSLEAFHREWFAAIAMRRGQQWIQVSHGAKSIFNPPEDPDRVRITINKLLGIHQTRLAKLIKDTPRPENVPASNSDEDKDLARKGSKLCMWVYQNNRMREKLKSLASWAIDCGSAFLFVYWDPEMGPKMPVYKRHQGPITGKEGYQIDSDGYVLDQSGQRITELISQGDVRIDVVSPFDVINDQVHDTVEDGDWLIMQRAMSLSDIRLKWPETGKDVKSEKDISDKVYYQRKLMGLGGNDNNWLSPEPSRDCKMATVKYCFERKTDKYPEGRYIVTANGKLLESGSLKEHFEHEECPVIKFDDIEVSGSFWGLSTITNCSPVQKGYNRTWSQILENANNMGNIKVATTKGHELSPESYDDTGYEILEIAPGADVHQLQPAELPGYVVNQLMWYDKAFEDVSGMHEVSQGRVPEGVKSGNAIMALQEQDETRLAPTKLGFYRVLEKAFSQALKLYEQFQLEDRTVRILGDGYGDMDEVKISRDEIQSMNKDVRIVAESLIGSKKELQREQIMDLWKGGLFGDPNKPEVRKLVASVMEFGNLSEMFEEESIDIRNAREENEKFVQQKELERKADPDIPGRYVFTLPTYDSDDHETHYRIVNQLRKSPRYRKMPPDQRRGIDLHAQEHLSRMNPIPLPPGGGPPPGVPPPPGPGGLA